MHPGLVPDLKKILSAFHQYDVSCGLSYVALIILKYIPSYVQFVKNIYHEWMLNFIKCPFCIYWSDNIFIYHPINVIYHIYWFPYVEPSLHPRDKSHLIMVYDPFSVLLNLVY